MDISGTLAGFGAAALALGISFVPPVAAAPVDKAAGPFAAASPLPFNAPPFDRIADGDFQPALEDGMRRQRAEIAAIADDPAPPTFQNTIVAMERSGPELDRVTRVFEALTQADTDDALQKVQAAEAPRRAAHHDAIYLNPRLFARVRAVFLARDRLSLDPEALQLVKIYEETFVRAGANLSEPDKAKLRAINTELSTLNAEFKNRLLAATKAGALVVDDRSELAGLDDAAIASAARDSGAARDAASTGLTGRWRIPLQNTTQQPDLKSLETRDVRAQLFDHGWTRAERGDANDTRRTVARLAQLRAQKAALLGYPNYAAYVLDDQMARTPEAVARFMAQLTPPTRAAAAREAAAIQAVIDHDGASFKLKPWDWNRYAEQVRKTRYDLDENQLKPYLELDNVLQNGVFYAANQLYGLTFKAQTDLPVYQPDVKVFEVFDQDGSALGLMYFDYFERDNKSGGAWMSNFVGQSKLLGTKPVIYNVANFSKPAAGQPALITFEDVTTMFHEFGHALHGLFANQEYPTLSGTHVARDFVEFPSQFNEHWALDPKVLAHYAVDYRTKAPMPQALVDKIKASAKFNQGYAVGEIVAAAELDLQWHTLGAAAPLQDVDAFETAALKTTGTDFPDVPPRYRSSYFQHIWGNDYAAGYYAYLWTEMLDDDVYAWFMQHGGLTRANGQRFRDLILSRGHTLDYGPMFRAFYGKDPDIGPMLEHRGLDASGS